MSNETEIRSMVIDYDAMHYASRGIVAMCLGKTVEQLQSIGAEEFAKLYDNNDMLDKIGIGLSVLIEQFTACYQFPELAKDRIITMMQSNKFEIEMGGD